MTTVALSDALGFGERLTARVRAGLQHELVIDNFAGAGGASLGIEAALGRCVDIAVNHSRRAIAIHSINHPHTRHLCEDVWDVDPLEVTAGRPAGLAWFSPDCKHFSKAKGGRPLSKRIRGLAWVVIRWAKLVRPRVIMLENVEEFQTWGPLDEHDKPIKAKAGQTYLRWVAQLRNLGYQVETRTIVAADYGVPTTRKRFFLIARRDGEKIVWPVPTHSKKKQPGLKPWNPAAGCIDWTLPCLSIFERNRPLADATLRRIARGLVKFVIEAKRPYIVKDVAPIIAQVQHAKSRSTGCHSTAAPMPTITAHPKGGGHALVVAFLQKHYGTNIGQSMRMPMPTITGGGQHFSQVYAFLVKYYSNGSQGQAANRPMDTITAKARLGLVTVAGEDYRIVDVGLRMLTPGELLRAQFGSFAGQYVLTGSKANQVAAIGNSVCPELAEALVAANVRIRHIKAAG